MITSFKLFESNLDIESICNRYNIENWELNPETGLVDVMGGVHLQYKNLEKLPLKFGMVSGDFYCIDNQLTSLEGAPKSVGGNFDCGSNKLTSLEGAPQSVGGDFNCPNNQLTSLEGAPQSIGEDFYCSNNKLTSLDGAPKSVGGNFNCPNNQLTSLEGAPKSVGGNFYCHDNQLTSLEGAPQNVGGNFYCPNNQLTSLEGAPQNVGGYFDCINNKLTKFRGIPEYSLNEEKSFYCEGNKIHEIYRLFNTPKCVDLINEYGVIGDGVISRVKLEEVFLELGLEIPKNLEFKNYKEL